MRSEEEIKKRIEFLESLKSPPDNYLQIINNDVLEVLIEELKWVLEEEE